VGSALKTFLAFWAIGLAIAVIQISNNYQPKAAGFAEGRIDYVPACKGMVDEILKSFNGRPIDRAQFNSIKREVASCNAAHKVN
jgi:hypothetical protein